MQSVSADGQVPLVAISELRRMSFRSCAWQESFRQGVNSDLHQRLVTRSWPLRCLRRWAADGHIRQSDYHANGEDHPRDAGILPAQPVLLIIDGVASGPRKR